MKSFWLAIVLFFSSLPWATAQGESDDFLCKVPPGLHQLLVQQHPEAVGVFWEQWDQGYKASFFEDGSSREVCFSNSGRKLMTCTYLELQELPLDIRRFLSTQFPDWEIPSLLAKIERPNHSVFYRIHLDLPEGMLELIFDDKGALKGRNLESYHRGED